MYKFILFIIYGQLQRIKSKDPREGAVSIVCIAIFFHIFFMLSLLDYFDLNLLRMTFGEVKNKYYWTPFVAGFMIFVWRYFNKERTEKIIKAFEAKGTKVNWTNTVIVLLVTILPLIIGIQFLNAKLDERLLPRLKFGQGPTAGNKMYVPLWGSLYIFRSYLSSNVWCRGTIY